MSSSSASSPKKRRKKSTTNKKKHSKNMQRKSHQHKSSNSKSRNKKKHHHGGELQTNLSYGIAVILLCLIGFLYYYSLQSKNPSITVKLETIEDIHRKLPSSLRLKYDHAFAMHNKYLRNSVKDRDAPIPFLFKANVSKTWIHDKNDFTQGFEVYDMDSVGNLIILESTGLYKQSKLKYIELKDAEHSVPSVQRSVSLKHNYFGEGCTVYFDDETQNKYIYQLTWKKRKVIVYDLDLNVIRELLLPSEMKEGWGIYYDYKNGEFVATDGSPNIYFIEPKTFSVTRSIAVRYMNNDREGTHHKVIKLDNLNEIEIVNGWIVVNVWYNTNIYIVSPSNGFVYGIIECWFMFPVSVRGTNHAVLNGIGFDLVNNQLIITGKNWPNIFAIEIPKFMMDKSLEDDTN